MKTISSYASSRNSASSTVTTARQSRKDIGKEDKSIVRPTFSRVRSTSTRLSITSDNYSPRIQHQDNHLTGETSIPIIHQQASEGLFECSIRHEEYGKDGQDILFLSRLLYVKTLKCMLYVTTSTQLIACIAFMVIMSNTPSEYSSNTTNQLMLSLLLLLGLVTLYSLIKSSHLLLALIQVILTVVIFFFLVLLIVWCIIRHDQLNSSHRMSNNYAQDTITAFSSNSVAANSSNEQEDQDDHFSNRHGHTNDADDVFFPLLGTYFASALFFTLKTILVREYLKHAIACDKIVEANQTAEHWLPDSPFTADTPIVQVPTRCFQAVGRSSIDSLDQSSLVDIEVETEPQAIHNLRANSGRNDHSFSSPPVDHHSYPDTPFNVKSSVQKAVEQNTRPRFF